MPIVSIENDRSIARDDPVVGSCQSWDLGDAAGLSQFGAYVERLEPGAVTSLRHWHKEEDELVYILSGELVLYEGASVTSISVGQSAAFPAGAEVGHYLRNESSAPATYLLVGTRAENEIVTYPRHNRIMKRDGKKISFTNLAGAPEKMSPYELVGKGLLPIEGES